MQRRATYRESRMLCALSNCQTRCKGSGRCTHCSKCFTATYLRRRWYQTKIQKEASVSTFLAKHLRRLNNAYLVPKLKRWS